MTSECPDAAFIVALSGLPGMGPVRLRALLAVWPPAEAWGRVVAGRALDDPSVAAAVRARPQPLGATWAAAARRVDVGDNWDAHRRVGVGVLTAGAGFPASLADDPEPPAVLFCVGDPGALDRPRVAVVGTRRCTRAGRDVAHDLGRDLAAVGVSVLSGLAVGIDGAAHLGALAARSAPPVAVVGTGLDVVYPRRHAALWRDVAAAGAIISEYPLGTPPERWRFPARNRILAALADVVVVVESHPAGGSMHTVEAALERDRTVMAVPGPVRSPASAGTNALLAAGCAPARDADDVLVALGLDSGGAGRAPTSAAAGIPLDGDAVAVLDAVGWTPSTLEQVAARLATPPGPVAVHLARLEVAGWLTRQGGWFERTGQR